MTKRRLALVVLLLAMVFSILLITATQGFAREILGCNGIIQWPCPGPAL